MLKKKILIKRVIFNKKQFLVKTFLTSQLFLDTKYRKVAVVFTRKMNGRQTYYQNLSIFNPDVFNSGVTISKKRDKWRREEQKNLN